jgi:hypothetical protein
MLKKVNFQDLRSVEYKKAWEYQEKLFDQILEAKSGETLMKRDRWQGICFFANIPMFTPLVKAARRTTCLLMTDSLKRSKPNFTG